MIIHHDLQHARHFPDKRERTGLLLTLLQQNLRLSAFSFFPSSSFFYDRQPRHPPNSSFFGQENVNRNPPQVFWWGDSNLIFFSYKITISSPEGKHKIKNSKTYGETFASENVRFIPVEHVCGEILSNVFRFHLATEPSRFHFGTERRRWWKTTKLPDGSSSFTTSKDSRKVGPKGQNPPLLSF